MLAVLVAAVALAAPAGFTENATLNTRAAYVSGKPVHVYCPANEAAWEVAANELAQTKSDALGFVDQIGGDTIYLSPIVCQYLLAKVRPASDLLRFGASLEVLAHEAEHLAGQAAEGDAECAALAVLPSLARTQFGIRKTAPLATIMQGARSRHRAAERYSPAYVGPCG